VTDYLTTGGETWQCPPWAKRPAGPIDTRRCLSCGVPIAWLKTVKDGLLVRVNQDGTAHLSTCPQAEASRKRQASREEAGL
jgi:hypothetical protein